ncbi:MAG: hypothetical protein GX552_19300, partial [Chloroflexi bacterium]|nr:hypothetical protein [Chloroflexota bacterium]
MTSREHVRAAIDHRPAERVPYAIDLCPDAADALRTVYGDVDMCGFINNDVLDISVPWWDWYHLADDWQGYAAPTSRAQVIGRGSYVDLADQIKAARDQSDKYFLVRIYGSHFE